ncbi:hypothetical protein NY547_19475 [Cnuibacter physcomitrellae]|uniref:hypothetical protein n=1 Tax=Cnuibacter physcomitrellae TaxID=1619308 RepID=UPI002175E92A|nr:hypothetical protein [Cnuibacter physcomitrellae]MCS5499429.1 hypothetical protein [Cnuibacter physcomitrellae]
MRALCTTVDSDDGRTIGGVEIGRTYTVVSMTVSPSGSYLSLIDGATPGVYPGSSFEIVDGELPGSWSAKVEGDGLFTLEPTAWGIPDFWVRYFDGDPLAVALYAAELPLLDGSRPADRRDLPTWLVAYTEVTEVLSWQRLFEALDDAGPSDHAAAAALVTLTGSTSTSFPLHLLDAELLHARLFLWLTDHGARHLTTELDRLLYRLRWTSGPSLRIALLDEENQSRATAIFLDESELQVIGACRLYVAE